MSYNIYLNLKQKYKIEINIINIIYTQKEAFLMSGHWCGKLSQSLLGVVLNLVFLSIQAVIPEIPQNWGLINNRNLFIAVLEAGIPNIKELADLVSVSAENPFPGS